MQFPLNYPLSLTFKIVSLAPQCSIRDAHGNLIAYVRQKLFKLKEAVTVFADEQQTQPLFTINADRWLDISARYNFTDNQGLPFGAVKRRGLKSLWRSHFDILEGDREVMTIQEENPWVKVMDGLFESIPLIGILSGHVFHPVYLIARTGGSVVIRVKKQPAFFEGRFAIEKAAPLEEAEEKRALLSLIMMLLLERSRG